MTVTLSKSNRHKVCNQCRKNKVRKTQPITNLAPPIATSLPGGADAVALHMPPMPDSIPAPVPGLGEPDPDMSHVIPHDSISVSMLNMMAPIQTSIQMSVVAPQAHGKMPCQCDKGGTCSRQKHFQDTACDRYVTITKNDKHTRCKGCRYLKKRKNAMNTNQVSQGVHSPHHNLLAHQIPPGSLNMIGPVGSAGVAGVVGVGSTSVHVNGLIDAVNVPVPSAAPPSLIPMGTAVPQALLPSDLVVPGL